ncbi:MAG: hypothetical protein JRJ29_02595 [Deltaproteobacteria bacterium]|nr:hypothetical protein [Deltaproteobacteria bacterium]
MGEIKSTLEIIMEKTRGLTMSQEDKEAYKVQEASRKIKGLVQKYVDGAIDLEAVKIEVAALEKDSVSRAKRMVLDEIMSRIDMEKDSEPLLGLLEEAAGLDIRPVREVLEENRRSLEAERASFEEAMLERLKEKGISGTAVIPNINADSEWIDKVTEAKEDLRKRLESCARSQLNSLNQYWEDCC